MEVENSRLTLTSSVAYPVSDVVGSPAIYLTQLDGEEELALFLDPVAHTSGSVCDLFVVEDNGVDRLVSGPAWLTETDRGSGAGTTELSSAFRNKHEMVVRHSSGLLTVGAGGAQFIGSFVSDGPGLATDSRDRRLLSNAYNIAVREVSRNEPAVSSAFSTAATRPANGDENNHIAILSCLEGMVADVILGTLVKSSTGTLRQVTNYIGCSPITPHPDSLMSRMGVGTMQQGMQCFYKGAPGLGLRRLYWLERAAGVDTQTWYYSGATDGIGMRGWCLS